MARVATPQWRAERAPEGRAARGVTLRQYSTEALREQLRRNTGEDRRDTDEPPRMGGFGKLAGLSEENRRILGLIEEQFERLSPEDLR